MASYFMSRRPYFHEPKASENTAYEWNNRPYSTTSVINDLFYAWYTYKLDDFHENTVRTWAKIPAILNSLYYARMLSRAWDNYREIWADISRYVYGVILQ